MRKIQLKHNNEQRPCYRGLEPDLTSQVLATKQKQENKQAFVGTIMFCQHKQTAGSRREKADEKSRIRIN